MRYEGRDAVKGVRVVEWIGCGAHLVVLTAWCAGRRMETTNVITLGVIFTPLYL
jgi:hypothetical protein